MLRFESIFVRIIFLHVLAVIAVFVAMLLALLWLLDSATSRLHHAAMLEQAAGVVVEMVHELPGLRLDKMKALNDRLRVIEMEADRLILELHRDIYSGNLDAGDMFLLKEFFEILEKAIDRCREAGVVAYEIVLKNS